MTKTIWLDPSLNDFRAHMKALISLPESFRFAESPSSADLVVDERNCPDLYLEAIKLKQVQISAELESMGSPLISFKEVTNQELNLSNAINFTESFVHLLGIQSNLKFQTTQTARAIVVQSESTGGLISGLFVESGVGPFGFQFTLSTSAKRIEMSIPLTGNAAPAWLSVHDKNGTRLDRPDYSSAARAYWISQAK